MQINQSPINFGSSFKVNITPDNLDKQAAVSNIWLIDEKEIKVYEHFTPINEASKTGVFDVMNISSPDKYDKEIEAYLKSLGINFEKRTTEELLDFDNIQKRIEIDEFDKSRGFSLVELNTEKFDEYFKNNSFEGAYIEPKSEEHQDGFDRFKKYLKTGEPITASTVYLREDNGRVKVDFGDGRHRYTVLRDMGMKAIPFAMDEKSFELAKKYGLIEK